jgi:tetratricopeptide (TPR) repeat protein
MKFHSILVGLAFVILVTPLSAQTTNATVSSAAPAAPVTGAPSLRPDPFSDPLIQQVEARHRRAVAGDAQETKKLTADLEQWTKQQPDNHLLQAYLGSTYTLDSRDAWPGPGKLTYLRNGGQLLDAAVLADPLNPAVRFVRAIDYFELPAIFGKRQVARDDFQILLHQIDGKGKALYALNADTIQAIYYYAGQALRQEGKKPEAREAWQRGLKLNPTSDLGVKIGAELAKSG